MKFGRNVMGKNKYALVFVIFLMFALFMNAENVKAAADVDISLPCSLTFKIPQAYQDELQAEEIPVRLYRIADMTATGEYVDLAGYESLKLNELSHYATAEQFEQKAKKAAKLLKVNVWQDTPATEPYAELNIVNNQGTVNQLEPGLYLVCVKPMKIGKMQYQALPYIISLPNLLEEKDDIGNVLQSWNYDLEVDLKLSCKDTTSKKEEVPENIPDVEPVDIPVKDFSSESEEIKKYKTGDDMILPLAACAVVFFGIAFMIVWALEKKNEKS